jgi:hypothetical protein
MAKLKRELERVKEENEILKRSGGILREKPAVTYAWMRKQERDHSVLALCRALRTSPSGYYAWRDREPSQREVQNAALAITVARLHLETRQNLGSDKLWGELRKRGVRCGRHRIARLRRRHAIITKRRRRFIRARKPYDRTPPAPRLHEWPFQIETPNQVWAGNITFIPTARGRPGKPVREQ